MEKRKPKGSEGPVRVLVVDDSLFMRVTIKRLLESDPLIQVVGVAQNGKEALQKVKELKPDLVTLDIEMPVMDGLSALSAIMQESPLPVLMLSSLTEEGAEASLRALELGAVDFIPKKIQQGRMGILEIREALIEKVRACAESRPLQSKDSRPMKAHAKRAPIREERRQNIEIVAIGASTGGPNALKDVIPSLPDDLQAAVLVVVHMPEGYTRAFAERLNRLSWLSVKEAEEGAKVLPGYVFIAPGGKHLVIRKNRNGDKVVHLSMEPADLPHRPSVDVMMHSVAEVYGDAVLGVTMTGMGQDGMEGMKTIKSSNGTTLAQDKDSSVVYGMPRAVAEAGAADEVVSLLFLGQRIIRLVGRNQARGL